MVLLNPKNSPERQFSMSVELFRAALREQTSCDIVRMIVPKSLTTEEAASCMADMNTGKALATIVDIIGGPRNKEVYLSRCLPDGLKSKFLPLVVKAKPFFEALSGEGEAVVSEDLIMSAHTLLNRLHLTLEASVRNISREMAGVVEEAKKEALNGIRQKWLVLDHFISGCSRSIIHVMNREYVRQSTPQSTGSVVFRPASDL